jgi:hypothetical protein
MKTPVVLLAIAFTAVTLMAASQASTSVSVGPQHAFQGTRPTPPGSGGPGVAFQGTRPTPPGSGGPGVAFQGTRPTPPGSGGPGVAF